MKLLILVSILFLQIYQSGGNLEQVQDDEVLNLIRTENYVVVLFSKKYCEICDNYETALTSIREDLVEVLNAWVVKVVDSQMSRLYCQSNEPAIVFFRHGIPLLYDGPLDGELIYHTFATNKEPVVKELTDDTFEHLTQAATGATTGDWFVMFYTSDCIECQRLQSRWEAVGAQLKSRMNVARVNRATLGAVTARRFDVFHVPAFILFQHGKLYRYQIQNYDIASFVSFAQGWYKNVKPEKVPPPKSSFDDLIALIHGYFHHVPVWFQVCLLIIFLSCFGISFLYIMMPSIFKTKRSSTEKKKGKNENKDK